LHCKQGNWSQVCEDSRPSRRYFHKTTQIWCFCKDEKYDESDEEWWQLILRGSVKVQHQLGFRVCKSFNIS